MSQPVRRGRRERGGALVEMVLLMIVVIPIIMYSVFLMDAVYMKVDLQENVVSGIWDWSTRNTEPDGSGDHAGEQNTERDTTQDMLRIVYADHTSAFDDGTVPGTSGYNVRGRLNSSIDHDKHHTGFGAQYTYQWGDTDTQFQCTSSDNDLSWNPVPAAVSGFKSFGTSAYSAGGQISCWAEAYIYNYIIPEAFLDSFSQTEMTNLTRREGSSHQWQGSGGANENIVVRESAALSYNTWALRSGGRNGTVRNNEADIGRPSAFFNVGERDTDNPFFKRVDYVTWRPTPFLPTRAAVTGAALSFANTARSQDIMVVQPVEFSGWAYPALPVIDATYLTARYRPEPGQNNGHPRQTPPGFTAGFAGHRGFQSTPYEQVNNNYRTAAGNRRAFYLGCRNEQRANCN